MAELYSEDEFCPICGEVLNNYESLVGLCEHCVKEVDSDFRGYNNIDLALEGKRTKREEKRG